MHTPEPLSPKVRWQAIFCYLVSWPSLVMILLLVANTNILSRNIGISQLVAWPLTMLVTPPLAWLLLRKNHPFIDSAGKTAVNLLLNLVVWSILIFLLVFFPLNIVCGSSSGMVNLTAVGLGLFIVSPFLAGFILTYLFLTMMGAWRAHQGQVSSFPLLSFIRD
jgi:uncharacterized Tic20 family protein